jgi:SAM-dependent methyltransferase
MPFSRIVRVPYCGRWVPHPRQSESVEPTSDDGLAGHGMLQSHEEWDVRNEVLVASLAELIERFAPRSTEKALDVGCQRGILTDRWAERTDRAWQGVDPSIDAPTYSPDRIELRRGYAHQLPFGDSEFDCVVLANVYEHILPERRRDSLAELRRVLTPGGVVVGQLPNPYFPIESHSRLPFMGWLPVRAQKAYWRLAPVPWEHDFYVVTVKDVRRRAEEVRLEVPMVRKFNYPPEVVPESVRWAARLLARPMRVFPWAWQFVLRRPA